MLNILANNRQILSEKAENAGIDWAQAERYVDFSGRKITKRIALRKKDGGKVAMWCNVKQDKDGNSFPFITFHDIKHGVTEVFNGWEALNEDRELGHFHKPFVMKSAPMTESAQEKAEKEKQKRAIETTLTRFNNSEKEDGTFPYLINKFGERSADFYNCDLRRDAHCIFFPIKISTDEVIGFQQIFAEKMPGTERDKNFIGKTSGGYFVIGDEARAMTDGAIFGEGMATGLAAYNAPHKRGSFSNGEKLPVIVCLDANNMPKVVRDFHARGCKNIHIVADNDANGKDGNVGIYAAMTVGREVGAIVSYPQKDGKKCDLVDTYNVHKMDLSKGSELDYLLLLMSFAPKRALKELSRKAASEICKDIPRKYSAASAIKVIDTALKARGFEASLTISSIIYRNVKKRRDLVKKLNKVFGEQLNVHDLSGASNDEIASHILEGGGDKIYYDNRGLGTGKTNMMIAVNDKLPHDTTAYITHRIALVKDACGRFCIASYEDLEPRQHIEKMGICVNSIPKFNVHQRFRVLFIDEARQVLEHILSGAVENRQAVFDEFILAIKLADLIIVSDADLNDKTIKFFKEHGGEKSHNIIKADSIENDKTLHIVADHKTNLDNILKTIKAGYNVIVASTSIKKTVELETLMLEQGIPEELMLVINSDNKGGKRQIAFLENPNVECVKYKIVIHSPTIGSGVSITTPHFDCNFLLNYGNLPANECLQMTARNRCAKNTYVSFSDKINTTRVTDVDLLMEGEGLKAARYLVSNNNGTYTPNELGRLRIELYAVTNADANDFANNFVLLAEINGMTIDHSAATTPLNWLDEARLKGLSTRATEKTVDNIFNSKVATEFEVEALSEKTAHTQEETDILKRHYTTKMVGLEQIERDDVKNYHKGMMAQLGLYEIFEADIAELTAWDKENHATKDKRYSKVSLHKLLNALFEVAASDGLIVTNETALRFCAALKRNAAELAANGMGNYTRPVKRPIMTMSLFLKRFGMELEKHARDSSTKMEQTYLLVENKTITRYATNRAAALAKKQAQDD